MSSHAREVVQSNALRSAVALAVVLAAATLVATPAHASPADDEEDRITFFGDFRIRLENDWDSRRADGTTRDDRGRARVRVRLGLRAAINDDLTFVTRARTAPTANHQSSNITVIDFQGNDTGPANFHLDQWYLRYERDDTWVWFGRNSYPFWNQNTMFWDPDASSVGFAAGTSRDIGVGTVSARAGYFAPPVGMTAFTGGLAAGQLMYEGSVGNVGFTLAGGHYAYFADDSDKDASVWLTGNGLRNYRIWMGSAQARFEAAGRPVRIGVDVMHNSYEYSSTDPDPFTAANHDQTNGYVLSAQVGKLDRRGDWLVGYYYANLEALALIASVAQDDWHRWGARSQSRSSDFRGHELRVGHTVRDNLEALLRLYIVESITTIEDGKRARLDLRWKF